MYECDHIVKGQMFRNDKWLLLLDVGILDKENINENEPFFILKKNRPFFPSLFDVTSYEYFRFKTDKNYNAIMNGKSESNKMVKLTNGKKKIRKSYQTSLEIAFGIYRCLLVNHSNRFCVYLKFHCSFSMYSPIYSQ